MANRYVVGVDLGGNAAARLDEIAGGVNKVILSFDNLNKSMGTVEKASFVELADRVSEFADKIEGAAHRMLAAGEAMIGSVIKDASAFEDAQASMRFAFGRDWESVYEQVLSDSARLTFTFKETVDLATSLGRMKINPFGGTTEASQTFKSKTGEAIRALDVLQDTADAVGKGTNDLVVSIRNAMAGQWRSLEDRFDIPKDKIKKWKQETDKLKDSQEKYNYLIARLAEMFGGAGAEKALNFSKAIVQIPDLLEQLRAAVGMEGLKVITKSIFEFVDALGKVTKDKDVIFGLSAGFMVFADVIAMGVRGAASLVKWTGEIIKMAPWLPRIAAYVALITFAGLAMTSMVVGATVAVLGLVAAVAALGTEGLALAAVLAVAVGPLLFMATTAAIMLGIAGKATFDILNRSADPAVSTLEKLKFVFQALAELMQTYNDDTGRMSAETAKNLKKAGLFEFVIEAFKLFHRFNVGWEAFKATLDDAADALGPSIIPQLRLLRDILHQLAIALGLTTERMREANSDTDDWASSGQDLADMLIAMTRLMLAFTHGMLIMINGGLRGWNLLKAGVQAVEDAFYGVFDALEPIAPGIGKAAREMNAFVALVKELIKMVPGLGAIAQIFDFIMPDPFRPPHAVKTGAAAGEGAKLIAERDAGLPEGFHREGGEEDEFDQTDFNARRRQRAKYRRRASGEGQDVDKFLDEREKNAGLPPGFSRTGADAPTFKPAPSESTPFQAPPPESPQTLSRLEAIVAAIKGLDMKVFLDSNEIAKAVHGSNRGVAG